MRSFLLSGVMGAAIACVLIMLAAGTWLWLGGFDASASSPRSRLAYTPLRLALVRHVEINTPNIPVPPKPDGHRMILGFRQYDAACAACHGTPDTPRETWAKSMNPAPPDLTQTRGRWSAKELYWVICHGVKMTGMPAFGVRRTDDDIWDLVFFVGALPGMTPQSYERMRASFGPAPPPFDLTPNATCLNAK